MKAIVYYTNGSPDVLRCEEMDKPVPEDGQVLLRVRAASLNPLDRNLMKTKLPYITRKLTKLTNPSSARPGRMGRDVAGQVEAVGPNVTQFKPGDEVFGVCAGSCSEYACASESKLALKPENVSFEEAASAPMAVFTALQGLRKGLVQPGQKVLINGAAGGVGSFAVQIAKSFGAEVTGVCSTKSVDLVRSIGADLVIDYTQQDFTKTGLLYDLVFDLAWNHSWSESRRAVNPDGRYVIAGGATDSQRKVIVLLGRLLKARILSMLVRPKFVNYMTQSNQEDLIVISKLMADGRVKPVIDRCYTLTQVPEAVRYTELGHAQGKVVISVE